MWFHSLMLKEPYLISNSLIELIKGVFLPLLAVSKSRVVRVGPHWSNLLLENLLFFPFLRPVVAGIHPEAADLIPISGASHRGTARCVHPEV